MQEKNLRHFWQSLFYVLCIGCTMVEKIKTGLSIFLILLLLPYVMVMLSGQQNEKEAVASMAAEKEEQQQLEQWVLEILPGQIPVTYELEALKAQAVIARSNLAFRMQEEGLSADQLSESKLTGWDMKHYSLMELREIWGEALFEGYYEKICRAVEETAGETLVYNGSYVDIPYHAVSAGQTRDGSLLGESYPYLTRVDCPGDLQAEDFLTVAKLDSQKFPAIQALEIISRDEAGYVTKIRVGEEVITGEEFRYRADLPSGSFTLENRDGAWVAVVKGLGHGFGLSEYQAQLQASQGKTYLEILQYFYGEMECISFS